MQSLKLRHLYGFEPQSVEHWVCLEATDLRAICKLLEMQHVSNTVGFTAQTPAMLFCIFMRSQVWRHLTHFHAPVILFDAEAAHILACGSPFALAPESFWHKQS